MMSLSNQMSAYAIYSNNNNNKSKATDLNQVGTPPVGRRRVLDSNVTPVNSKKVGEVKPKSSIKKMKMLIRGSSKKKKKLIVEENHPDIIQSRMLRSKSSASPLNSTPPLPPRLYRHSSAAIGRHAPSNHIDFTNKLSADVLSTDNQLELSVPKKKMKLTSKQTSLISLTSSPADRVEFLRTAEVFFQRMIEPVPIQKFFGELWEEKPLLIKRKQKQHNSEWFSTAELNDILTNNRVNFTENIDVVTYKDGERKTLNPVGRAYPSVVWDYFQEGCSVRLLNPQTYSDNVWKFLTYLQEYFGCVAGANVYLTPANSQGFAPHYDDIEAFVLQLEGRKHWRVYEPRNDSEVLPRYSSPNFTDNDLGEPVLDDVLEPGSLLYFPRGYIHQANTLGDIHSLHITVSVGQKNTWGDLLSKLLPRAVDLAMEEDAEFRRSLPINYLQFMGVAYSDRESDDRNRFLQRLDELMTRLINYAPVDAACDQMGQELIHSGLPPVIEKTEHDCGVWGHPTRWTRHQVTVGNAITLETRVRVLRPGVLRIVSGEDTVMIYHSVDNIRIYQGVDPQYIEVEPEMAVAVEQLLHTYPEYTTVSSLPLDSSEDKLELINLLFGKGLLITQQPL